MAPLPLLCAQSNRALAITSVSRLEHLFPRVARRLRERTLRDGISILFRMALSHIRSSHGREEAEGVRRQWNRCLSEDCAGLRGAAWLHEVIPLVIVLQLQAGRRGWTRGTITLLRRIQRCLEEFAWLRS